MANSRKLMLILVILLTAILSTNPLYADKNKNDKKETKQKHHQTIKKIEKKHKKEHKKSKVIKKKAPKKIKDIKKNKSISKPPPKRIKKHPKVKLKRPSIKKHSDKQKKEHHRKNARKAIKAKKNLRKKFSNRHVFKKEIRKTLEKQLKTLVSYSKSEFKNHEKTEHSDDTERILRKKHVRRIKRTIRQEHRPILRELKTSLSKLHASRWAHHPKDTRGQGNNAKVTMLAPYGHEKDSDRKVLYGNRGRVIRDPEPTPSPKPIPKPAPVPAPIPEMPF